MGLREVAASKQGIGMVAIPTSVAGEFLFGAKQASVRAPAVRTMPPVGVEVPLQPDEAQAIIHHFSYWKIDHALSLPYLHTVFT